MVATDVLVTNAHVIADAVVADLRFVFPSRGNTEYQAVALLHDDIKRDISVMRITEQHPWLSIAESHVFRPAEQILIIGSPGVGEELVLQNAVTQGLLSTVTQIDGVQYYQLSASINPGNSGGPVLDQYGKVIAVATLKATRQEGLAFGVPAAAIAAALADARALPEASAGALFAEHNAKAAFYSAAIMGRLYVRAMKFNVEMMDLSIQGGGSSDHGLSNARSVVSQYKELAAKYKPDQIDAVVRAMRRDEHLDQQARDDLLAFWSLVKEAKGYVESPRGSFVTYREKCNNVEGEFDRLRERLMVRLDAEDRDSAFAK